jgi:hypothetical protein
LATGLSLSRSQKSYHLQQRRTTVRERSWSALGCAAILLRISTILRCQKVIRSGGMYFTGSVRIHISACDDFRLCSARLRYADAHRQCPPIGEDQKLSAHGQSDEIVRPWLRCGSSSAARSGAPTSSSTRHSSMSPASCVRDTRAICSCRSPVICPSGGLSTGVSSPVCKNISVFTSPKSLLELFVSHPTRGAYHDRHGRGMGCGGRGSVLRAMGLQGGSKHL